MGIPALTDVRTVLGHSREWNWYVISLAFLNVIGNTGQQCTLPVFLDKFGSYLSPYFALLFLSAMFGVIFTVWDFIFVVARKALPAQIPALKSIAPTGMADAMNGVLVVYSAPTTRLPATVSSMLFILQIPATYCMRLLSKQLRRSNVLQKIALVVTTTGAFVYLIPYCVHTQLTTTKDLWAWIAIGSAGVALGCAMNVFTESSLVTAASSQSLTPLERIRLAVWFEKWRSLFQVTAMLVLSVVDIIPWFGFSNGDYPHVWTGVLHGFECFAGTLGGTCSETWYTGLLFALSYILSYLTSDVLTWEHEANLSTLVSTISTPVSLFFYLQFPDLTAVPTDTSFVPYAIIALLLIVVGNLIYIQASRPRGEEGLPLRNVQVEF